MEFKLFDKWDTNITVNDPGLRNYINLKNTMVPRTLGRNAKYRFYKSQYSHIVERLANKLMVTGHKGKKHKISSGHYTGKSQVIYKIIIDAFEVIEKKIKKNPLEVFVRAVENAAPRDEITSIEYGGAKYPQAVECSPQRRIDITLRQMAQGAYSKSFNKKKKMKDALAEEIINAYEVSQNSQAISKKLELERRASSSR